MIFQINSTILRLSRDTNKPNRSFIEQQGKPKTMIEDMQKVLKRREKEKEERENKDNNNFVPDYEEVQWCDLKDKQNTVFRILGNPYELRQKPSDVKLVPRSKIVTDTGSQYIKVNWKTVVDPDGSVKVDKDWLLYKLLDKIQEGTWNNPPKEERAQGKKGTFVHTYAGKEVFNRVKINKTEKDRSNQFANNFYPSQVIFMNVDDPSDDWCIKNKHSKLLSSKVEVRPKKEGEGVNTFVTEGIPKSIYDMIIDKLVSAIGHWNYTIVIHRDGKAETNKYEVKHWQDPLLDVATRALTSDAPLNETQKAYELYDLDKLYPVTSYTKLRKHLSGLFKGVDALTGSNFFEELDRLADEEEKERASNEPAPSSENKPAEVSNQTPKQEEKAPEPVRQPRTTVSPVKDDLTRVRELFPAFDKVSEDERKEFRHLFKGFDSNGNIIWNEVASNGTPAIVLPCECCGGIPLPNSILECLSCGAKLT